MARSEDENKEFGEPLKHDPTFNGPLHKRSCTDIICLLIFIAFVVAWAGVGIYAFTHGDPNRLIAPVDSRGRVCGVDDDVSNRPYLFYFDFMQCARSTVVSGCPTPQVCVPECPTEHFSFVLRDPRNNDWMKRMICKIGVTVQNEQDAQDRIDSNECASYYLASRPVLRHCLPDVGISAEEFQDLLNRTDVELQDLIDGRRSVNIFMQAKEVSQQVVQDLNDSWPYIVAGLALAMVVCLIYIVLMRWFAGVMVWVSILGTIVLLAYCVFATYMKWNELRTTDRNATIDQGTNQSPMGAQPRVIEYLEESWNDFLAMQTTWLVFLILSSIALVIVVLLVIFLRKRILIAVALIKEASKAVGSITSSLFFPLFPWLLQLLVLGWFVAVFLFLAGSTSPVYRAVMDERCTCNTSNGTITNGDVCYPDTFSEKCGNVANLQCLPLGNLLNISQCQFFSNEQQYYVNYLHAFNIFGIFWGVFFVSAIGQMVLAGTFATWYWTFNKADVPFFTVTRSMARTFRYHLGTLAFGSLILAICRIIRVILEYLDHKLRKYDNCCIKAIMCCLRCFFWCLEKFIKFINKNAYIMCAIYGKNFCRSARKAFNLLMRNIIRVIVLDQVTGFLLFMGKLMITAGMCALAFYVFTETPDVPLNGPVLNYSVVPILIIGFGTYFIASIFFGVYSMAVDTIFLCFLEDSERNDGSAEKPYFMSRNLMNILGKKNK